MAFEFFKRRKPDRNPQAPSVDIDKMVAEADEQQNNTYTIHWNDELKMCEEGERMFRNFNKKPELAETLERHACLLYKRGDLEKALALLKQCESLAGELGNLGLQAKCLGLQGLIHTDRELPDEALRLIQKSGELYSKIGKMEGVLASLSVRCVILQKRRDWPACLSMAREMERISRPAGTKRQLHESFEHQGRALKEMKEYEGALRVYREAEKISREEQDSARTCLYLYWQAEVKGEQGRTADALSIANAAYELADESSLHQLIGALRDTLNSRSTSAGEKVFDPPAPRMLGAAHREPSEFPSSPATQDQHGMTVDVAAEAEQFFPNDPGRQQAYLGRQAAVLIDAQKYSEGLDLLKKQEEIARKHGLFSGLVDAAHNRVGVALRIDTRESLIEALSCLGRFADECRAHQKHEALTDVPALTGTVLCKLARFCHPSDIVSDRLLVQGCSLLESVLSAVQMPEGLAVYKFHKAEFCWTLRDNGRALDLFSEALALVHDGRNKQFEVLLLYRKALCLGALGRHLDVAKTARRAWDLAVEIKDQGIIAELDDLFDHLRTIGISKPDKDLQVSFVVKPPGVFLANTPYRYIVIASDGLCASECAQMVRLFAKTGGEVEIEKGGNKVSGKSIMGLMTLEASRGSLICIRFSQSQDGHALDALIKGGIILPDGTYACYACSRCGGESRVRADEVDREMKCPSCGGPNLLRLEKYDVRMAAE